MLSAMSRHKDWAVLVCLVGNGQEINRGEAGIGAWFSALLAGFPDWEIYLPPRIDANAFVDGGTVSRVLDRPRVYVEEGLHLATGARSFRAESVSTFVNALIAKEETLAQRAFAEIGGRFPIVVTRDAERARAWLRTRMRGTQRAGVVATSKARRLRPYAMNVRAKIEPEEWFLNPREDIRSSSFLEEVATEFDIQGLELDWVCVAWDADLRMESGEWRPYRFRGTSWQRVWEPAEAEYCKNAYRVLLTRARLGMVLFVPEGDRADETRQPRFYDAVFQYLRGLGIPEMQ